MEMSEFCQLGAVKVGYTGSGAGPGSGSSPGSGSTGVGGVGGVGVGVGSSPPPPPHDTTLSDAAARSIVIRDFIIVALLVKELRRVSSLLYLFCQEL